MKFEEQVNNAWDKIIDQKFDYCKNLSEEKGKGLHIFKRVVPGRETDNYNCDYYFIEYDSDKWKEIIALDESHHRIEKQYDENKHILILIQIYDESSKKHRGDLRLLSISSKENIIPVSSTIDKKQSGLRKRTTTNK